ncbi:MAG: DegT/DnrJ/EryC1/StrS family aminotransferase [Cytophagales bacterium]|nr:DegT/DnrJ/EryC1/StrS family aminotransferase [Cytophagales bacterium]
MIEYENLHLLNKPFMTGYRDRFEEVMNSGWFILGKQVKEFEREFGSYCGSSYCLGVANGLDALTLALRCFDFKVGSEVIVPSNTYIATILSILNCQLKPVLVEPDLATYNIDPTCIEEAITEKTVAIMVVHLYGKPCAMDEITAISKKFQLKLIEDCAQAHGARHKDRMVGTFGDIGAFSFYPTKNLGALGDGGCITTDDEEISKRISFLRNYGSDRKYYNEIIGVNSRLDELQAAFLSVKLRSLDKINDHKRKLAALYEAGLKSDFVKPILRNDSHDVYHIYNVRHPKRDALKGFMEKEGVKTEVHYPVSPHKQLALRGLFSGLSFPISEEIHATTLSLPISYMHSEADVSKVVDIMNKF